MDILVRTDDNILYNKTDIADISVGSGSLAGMILPRLESIESDRVILIDGCYKIHITAGQLYEQSIRVARCLQKFGIRKGDSIALCSENRIEFPIVLLGAFALNVTVATLNVTYTERELDHGVNLSKPKMAFCSPFVAGNMTKVVKSNKFIQKLIVFGDKAPLNAITFKKFLDYVPVCRDKFTVEPTDTKETVAVIVCSSGTTGLPKGVQLTQNNIIQNFNGLLARSQVFEIDTLLSVIPWFHSYGCISLISVIFFAFSRMVFLPRFEEELFLQCIEKYKVKGGHVVPPLMVFLAKHPLVDKYDLSSLKVLLSGAAPLSKETIDAVRNRIGVTFIYQGYGLSETTLGVLVQKQGFEKPGSVGTLLPGMYGKVIDPDSGKALGPNQQGELCFKGPMIMKGYTGSSENPIDKDGWLHTGDIGYYDDDQEFFIVDRIKELIKYKGFQVPPAEIEAILLTNPKIKDAAVIGIPDELSGELPFAFVVKQSSNTALTEKEVVDYVAKTVSPAKRLRGGVEFISEIPKNPSGKILRRVLKEHIMKSKKSKL